MCGARAGATLARATAASTKEEAVDYPAALWGGIVGAIVMATVYAGFQGLRLTRFDLVRFEGGFLAHERHGMVYLYGAIVQIVLGAVVALLYRLAFLQFHHSATNVGWGALIGLGQGVLVALALPVLGLLNQNVRAGDQPTPGLAGRRYGPWTPLAIVVATVVYGLWVGMFLVP
jgi:hypothetical protein